MRARISVPCPYSVTCDHAYDHAMVTVRTVSTVDEANQSTFGQRTPPEGKIGWARGTIVNTISEAAHGTACFFVCSFRRLPKNSTKPYQSSPMYAFVSRQQRSDDSNANTVLLRIRTAPNTHRTAPNSAVCHISAQSSNKRKSVVVTTKQVKLQISPVRASAASSVFYLYRQHGTATDYCAVVSAQ